MLEAKIKAFPGRSKPGGSSLEMLAQFVRDSVSEVMSPSMWQDIAAIFQSINPEH